MWRQGAGPPCGPLPSPFLARHGDSLTLTLLSRALPPLPLAGEGWGEGNLVEAFRALALTLPSPAGGRGERRVSARRRTFRDGCAAPATPLPSASRTPDRPCPDCRKDTRCHAQHSARARQARRARARCDRAGEALRAARG